MCLNQGCTYILVERTNNVKNMYTLINMEKDGKQFAYSIFHSIVYLIIPILTWNQANFIVKFT